MVLIKQREDRPWRAEIIASGTKMFSVRDVFSFTQFEDSLTEEDHSIEDLVARFERNLRRYIMDKGKTNKRLRLDYLARDCRHEIIKALSKGDTLEKLFFESALEILTLRDW